ncbi:MAG: hypothetical protein VZS44_00830 [Bacilli bacterium]|nr:hypothetical protein [Bacilli bacterium]
MNNRELELQSEDEKILVKMNRVASKISGDAINELVEKIDDYSVYSLFEPIILMLSCSDDYILSQKYFEKTNKDSPYLDEESLCRRKVYHVLKNSGYDDFYIEDNIEKYTEMLLNFYSNPERIINIIAMYDVVTNDSSKNKGNKARVRKQSDN